jgi:CRISPR-associated protein Cas8a1/Csx13
MGKGKKLSSPDHLTMSLFAPGMSAMHRAGLGGLACTLKAMGRTIEGPKPWEVSAREIILNFGKPEKAEAYLKKLFEFAFKVRKDGLISLPGQYRTEPPAAALADLQAGFTLTFLQHGKVRTLAKEPTVAAFDPEGEGNSAVTVQYRKCSDFKHQEGWKSFVDKNGCLVSGSIKIDGPISPGSVVRHVAFTSDTAGEDPPERMLPLYFALVGCMSLPVNRGVAALLVPEVTDLLEFAIDRPAMTPTAPKECQIANAADAALQAMIRLRARGEIKKREMIPGFHAMTFMPTPWASQQKSRVATLHVSGADDKALDRFACALAHLPTRIVTRTIKDATGRGKSKVVTERREAFRSESVVRPLMADNLAVGRPWFAGFARLMLKINPATDKPYRNQLSFERKGLHDMINDKKMWDIEGQAIVVRAVHQAISQTLGRIKEETDGKEAKKISKATENRWNRFQERLRLDLAGAKTQAQVRFALTDLFSRGGNNSVLRESWVKVLPVIQGEWTLARDLGLLALASYAGKGQAEDSTTSETK